MINTAPQLSVEARSRTFGSWSHSPKLVYDITKPLDGRALSSRLCVSVEQEKGHLS